MRSMLKMSWQYEIILAGMSVVQFHNTPPTKVALFMDYFFILCKFSLIANFINYSSSICVSKSLFKISFELSTSGL